MAAQELEKSTERAELCELSFEELDAVAGGKTLMGAFVSGFLAYAPDYGLRSISKAMAGCF
jgi:hypothetical protein